MSIPRELRKAIESGRGSTVEDAWLERLESDRSDLDFFTSVARQLVGSGDAARAAMLLELLDEQLRADGEWDTRLELLERAGDMLLPAEDLHPQILATLERLYADSESRPGLIDKVGLERGVGDLPKIWEKVRRLRALLQFEADTPVKMEGKGVGRVAEVNLSLDSFKIEFDDGRELRVGFAAAPKLLEPLPEGHFLRRKLEEPEALRELGREHPVELLRLLLESAGEPLTAAAIREAMAGIVGAKEWTSWWAAARRHPQVVTGGQGRQTYAWAGTSAEALAETRRAFEAAGTGERLKIFQRNRGRDEDFDAWMRARLEESGRELVGERPQEALAIWAALEKAGEAPADRDWSPAALVAGSRDPVRLVAAIDERALRESALDLVREQRREWPVIYRGVLELESDGRVLDRLFDALAADQPQAAERFIDEVLSQPSRRPAAFAWLVERAGREPLLGRRNPLPVLQQLTHLDGDRAFAPYRARLRKLWEAGGHVHLLDRLQPEQAPRAEEILERAPMEEFLRTPYLNALRMRFPDLGGHQDDALYATAESIEARRAELKRLLDEEIPANRRAIEAARELGDLRENFEYKSARQRHEYLSARAAKLDGDLRRVRVIDPERVDGREVRIGSRFELVDAAGERRREVTILGPWESHPEEGVFSYDSEIAQSVLGKKAGEQVELEGEAYRIGTIGSFRGGK